MAFDVGELLVGLFGGDTAAVLPVPVASGSPSTADGIEGVSVGLVPSAPLAMPSALWLDDEAEPLGPCPKCGGLEPWFDGWGRRRCVVCEGDILGRALALAATAARLRANRPPTRPVVASEWAGATPKTLAISAQEAAFYGVDCKPS